MCNCSENSKVGGFTAPSNTATTGTAGFVSSSNFYVTGLTPEQRAELIRSLSDVLSWRAAHENVTKATLKVVEDKMVELINGIVA